jgi:hypothetical protein
LKSLFNFLHNEVQCPITSALESLEEIALLYKIHLPLEKLQGGAQGIPI